MEADVLTIGHAVTLGSILDACIKTQPATWLARYPDTGELVGDGSLVSGTMRAVVADNEGRGLLMGSDKDVRDGFVWVSGMFEHFFPMRDVMRWVEAGEFSLNYRA